MVIMLQVKKVRTLQRWKWSYFKSQNRDEKSEVMGSIGVPLLLSAGLSISLKLLPLPYERLRVIE